LIENAAVCVLGSAGCAAFAGGMDRDGRGDLVDPVKKESAREARGIMWQMIILLGGLIWFLSYVALFSYIVIRSWQLSRRVEKSRSRSESNW